MSVFNKYCKEKEVGRKIIDIFSIGHLFTGVLIFALAYISLGNTVMGITERYYVSL